jgi:hypothetical protein
MTEDPQREPLMESEDDFPNHEAQVSLQLVRLHKWLLDHWSTVDPHPTQLWQSGIFSTHSTIIL